MVGAFNTVYKAFQGLLSADFWGTVLVPVALFAALHLAILTQFGWHPTSDDLFGDTGRFAKAAVAALAGLVVAGYVLQSFLPLLRGMLDGSLLPAWLHDGLRRDRKAAAREVRAAICCSLATVTAFEGERDQARQPAGWLRTAYAAACLLPGAPDEASVRFAERAMDDLSASLIFNPSLEQVAFAKGALSAALSKNNPDFAAAAPGAGLSARLDRAQERLIELLAEGAKQAGYEYQVLLDRTRVSAALDAPRATRLGDARYVVERYATAVYQVNFDFLWPRLLMVLRAEVKDDPSIAGVEAARSRVDFAALSLLLTCSVPALWLPAAMLLPGPGWLVLVIGGATPLLLQLFYRMAVEGQLALGDVVRTTIDRHRFLVLQMLHQPVPTTRTEERRLWSQVRQAEEDSRIADLVYAAPSKATKP